MPNRGAMSERPRLSEEHVSDAAKQVVAGFHRGLVDEVSATVARDRVVVVGMAQNPVVKKARALLTQHNVQFTYLEYGSYFSKWRERLAIKLWAGFPTFPMVFIEGKLVGGLSEITPLANEGKLPQ